MRRQGRARVGLLGLLLGVTVLGASQDISAEGTRGSGKDRLDWPGSTTDRYLDAEEISAALAEATDEFAACASPEGVEALDGSPLWLTFSIDPQGRPQPQGVSEQDTVSPLYQCLLTTLKTVTFSDHDGVPGLYSYPIVFFVEEGAVQHAPYPVVLFEVPALRLPLLTLPPDLSQDDLEVIAAELLPRSP